MRSLENLRKIIKREVFHLSIKREVWKIFHQKLSKKFGKLIEKFGKFSAKLSEKFRKFSAKFGQKFGKFCL